MDVKLKKISISHKGLPKPKRSSDHESRTGKCPRFLITVNVLGSSGPMRFLANENDSVSGVIDAALKLYAREERLPALGSDVGSFLLYPANAGLDALSPLEAIGSQGLRSFVLCKKERLTQTSEARSVVVSGKRSGSSWKAWINKSLSSKILSH